MPRPPILPVLDWRSIFESGVEFGAWLEAAEFPEHRQRMEGIFAGLSVDTARLALLRGLPRNVSVVAIAEDWCGDVVRFAPVMARLAELSEGRIRVRFISRDQYPDVFVRFLTNGGEAIPKFVFLNDQFTECGNWGPMPSDCRRILSRGKGAGDLKSARERVSRMYEADSNFESAVRELVELAETAACERP